MEDGGWRMDWGRFADWVYGGAGDWGLGLNPILGLLSAVSGGLRWNGEVAGYVDG